MRNYKQIVYGEQNDGDTIILNDSNMKMLNNNTAIIRVPTCLILQS